MNDTPKSTIWSIKVEKNDVRIQNVWGRYRLGGGGSEGEFHRYHPLCAILVRGKRYPLMGDIDLVEFRGRNFFDIPLHYNGGFGILGKYI